MLSTKNKLSNYTFDEYNVNQRRERLKNNCNVRTIKPISNHNAFHAESLAVEAARKHPQSIEISLSIAEDSAIINRSVIIFTSNIEPLYEYPKNNDIPQSNSSHGNVRAIKLIILPGIR